MIIIRFGREWENECMIMDDLLAKVEYDLSNFCSIFLVDIE